MGLGNWGQELQNAAGAFFGSQYLRDYTHASKIFRSNSYANAPKFKFLFHTYFAINTDAWPEAASQNIGILVKDVKLPTYNFQTEVKNQYNRKRIIQTKIKYEPISISFHDDNQNTVNRMWYAYYTYYYKDARKIVIPFTANRGNTTGEGASETDTKPTGADYYLRDIYTEDLKGEVDWGYIGEPTNGAGISGQSKVPFFKHITVFGFNQHDFTAYTLINPIITQFSHDTYDYSEGGGVMKNTMNIDYETVVYNEGAIDGRSPGDIVTGFGDEATYDRTNSPINTPGANGTALGQGGLIDAAGGFVSALTRGDVGGVIDAVKIAGTSYNTFKNMDLKNTLKQELSQDLISVIRDVTPQIRNISFSTPSKTQTPNATNISTGTATPAPVGDNPTAGNQISGPTPSGNPGGS